MARNIETVATLTVILLLGLSGPTAAADRTETVHFKPGTTSATLAGSIEGYDGVRYVLGARSGQAINEPEFKAVFADIERDMARQRAALAARPTDAPLDLNATGT